MVVLNRIYTRQGDDGSTALGTGQRVAKDHARVAAFGAVDEANATLGLTRLHTSSHSAVDAMLARVQNDLFDLGADLCTPEGTEKKGPALRILPEQVAWLESHIDTLNADLVPLRSFVLPGGTPASACLHLARTQVRRAERAMVTLAAQPGEGVGAPALHYVNRLSDLLFVAARYLNQPQTGGMGDVLWVPGGGRNPKPET